MITDRFDAEEVWRTVERERVNSLSVTGDAMARPLADTLETLRDELDLSCVVSFSSTAAIFSQTVKEQLQQLLPDYVVMTDAIGSTESGMNGIRIVQKGDAPKEGITSVQASADSVVLDDDFDRDRAGLGQGRPRRARRQHPDRLLQRPRQDRGGVRHRRRRVGGGRSPATSRRSKPTDGSPCSDAVRRRSTRVARRSIPKRSKVRSSRIPTCSTSSSSASPTSGGASGSPRCCSPDPDAPRRSRPAGALPRPHRGLQGAA